MKKILIVLLVLLCTACVDTKEKNKKQLHTFLNKTYIQKKIIYVNSQYYDSKKEALLKGVEYTLNKNSILFESDLDYNNITYKEAELTDIDKNISDEFDSKFILYSNKEVLGITIFLSDKNIYIGNNTLDQRDYTYIAKLKKRPSK